MDQIDVSIKTGARAVTGNNIENYVDKYVITVVKVLQKKSSESNETTKGLYFVLFHLKLKYDKE